MSKFFEFKSKEKEKEFVDLIKATGSSDMAVAKDAQQAFASIISSSLARVLEPLSVSNEIFTEVIEYSGDDPPEIPIDPYFDLGEGFFRIWSNGIDGGTAYNEISGDGSYRFRTVRVDSAIAWLRSYARAGRLDVVRKGLRRLVAEVQVKLDFLAFSVLAASLGNARTNGLSHVIESTARINGSARKFQLDDLNRLMTLIARINMSWANSSTSSSTSGLTDLYLSPEAMEEIRRMTYNPMNTTAIPDTNESTAMPLPDEMRMEIYRSGGATSLYGKRLHELKELGVGSIYNELFRRSYNQSATGGPTWTAGVGELVIGIDKSMGAFAQAVNVDSEIGSSFTLEVDDQHLNRSKKMGYFGAAERGYVAGNNRAIVGLLW